MTRVLAGVRVLELGTMITAPVAGMMLADLGADVVKVENPKGGDPFRNFRGGLYSPHFTAYNRNKRSLTLNLQSEAGKGALLRLLPRADVLIENYRAGVMERLGLGAAALAAANPGLIHCSITGFGASGPYAGRPAFDTIGSALGGITGLFVDREKPRLAGPTITDNATGIYACYGILGALFERARTGKGRRVEVNMLEASIAFMPDMFANFTQMGIRNDPFTRVSTSQSYALRCADGKLLAVHLSSPPKFWEGLLAALERPDLAADPRFGTREARVKNYGALYATLQEIAATRPRGDWMTRLEKEDVPFAPIHEIAEVLEDEQVRHLGTFYRTHHPTEGAVTGIHRPVRIDGSRDIAATPPPALGEHSDAILAELGYGAADIAALRAAGAI